MAELKQIIIEGIIMEADYGYGLKYKDQDTLYLKLRVQQFDGWECIQLFKGEKISQILDQFKGDYYNYISINQLVGRKLVLLQNEVATQVPDAISCKRINDPRGKTDYDWIENDNWN